MNSKVLIAAVAVVIVVIAAVAVYLVFSGGGSDDDGGPVDLELRTDLTEGDYYTYSTETTIGGESESHETTLTVASIQGATVYVRETFDGITGDAYPSDAEEFLSGLTVDEAELAEYYEMTGTEVIDTPMGRVSCSTWVGEISNATITLWIGEGNEVLFQLEAVGSHNGESAYGLQQLTGTSLFAESDDPEPPAATDELRMDLVPGDYSVLEVTDTYDGVTQSYVNTFTVRAVADGFLSANIRAEGDIEYDRVAVVTTEGFLLDAVMYAGGDQYDAFDFDGTETITTSFGEKVCSVGTYRQELFDTWQETTIWVGGNDVVYLMQVEFSDGEFLTMELTGTSLFDDAEPYEHPDAPCFMRMELTPGDYLVTALVNDGYADVQTRTVLSVEGDQVTYTLERSTDLPTTITSTVEEFFMELVIDTEQLDSLTPSRSETVCTLKGDVDCNVYESSEGGTSYAYWINPDSGVMFHMERQSASGTSEFFLLECSFLEESP